jgi:hypothetical protein
MGPASPHSAAANELREEANDGRLIAAAAVSLPAPDRFRTWENEVPSLVCNASARASGRWKLLLAPLSVGDLPFVHWHHYERVRLDLYVRRYGARDELATRVNRPQLTLFAHCTTTVRPSLRPPASHCQ